ncbi:hypothetical protein [Prauserella endophytica]|uniref:hypothetical protein n=1 Tax=Prauserella endophytica TaxID=1592324 RepID=UPI00130532C4|nr:hypothetical protein [Prauserella endophytica]
MPMLMTTVAMFVPADAGPTSNPGLMIGTAARDSTKANATPSTRRDDAGQQPDELV